MKLIVFDLDGVLVDAKKIHYEMLNKALGEKYSISMEEHLNRYDGLKTTQKLEMISKEKDLPLDIHSDVWKKKQQYTIEALKDLKPSQKLKECFERLEKEGLKIACCSNSIRKTVITVLSKLQIIEHFDLILSNEDVKNAKPHPEIYWKCMAILGVLPEETLIVEDSPHGLFAAYKSNANVLRVKNPNEVTFENIEKSLKGVNKKNMPKWKDEKLNVVIPMAGAGSRFEKAGYTFPKPLIDIKGKAMIQVVVENLNLDANYIFIVQKSHREKYNLDNFLKIIAPNCKIVETDGITEGAACTTLLAKEHINNDNPLIMANSDQFVVWDSNEFMYKMNESDYDAGIVTFNANHPKWSFVKLNEHGLVCEVAEKNPISDIATVGIYYWKKGSDYVKYAEKMIEKNIRVNNEFYVCPVFNEAILEDKKIKNFQINEMYGLGTPEDLSYFLENYK
jgi:HAD superfamily hydrolase (TIGR01509 family)